MRLETTSTSIRLVEALPDGMWAVRWDIKPLDDGVGLSYEEEQYAYVPSIEDIQRSITEWYNKQTESLIRYGFVWNGRKVYLSEENKFNFKAIIDECARVETSIALWDKEHPDLAGADTVYSERTEANGEVVTFGEPTGRPQSLLPVTLKLGETNSPENFYVFKTLTELQNFFNAGVHHLIDAYGAGWMQIANFDFEPYEEVLEKLMKK